MNLVNVTRGRNASASLRIGPTTSANRGANQLLPGSPKTRCMSMTASQDDSDPARPADGSGRVTPAPAAGP